MTGRLLDTCIVIDFLRQRPAAVTFLNTLATRPVLSCLTVMELNAGIRTDAEQRALDLTIGNSTILAISGEISAQAGKYLRQFRPAFGIDPIDALIAASAKHYEIELVTLNLKHFPMFKELKRPY